MDVDQFKREWEAASLGEAAKVLDENWTQSEIFLHNILQLLAHQTDVLEDIRTELVTMRMAAETEAVEDSEDPFQTLNGPSHVRTDA